MQLPWEAKAAELEQQADRQVKQSRGFLDITTIDDIVDERLKLVMCRVHYVWKLSVLAGASMVAAAIALHCSRIKPYDSVLQFMVPAVVGALLTPLVGRLAWLPAAVHGIPPNRSPLILFFFTALFLQMAHLMVAAIGWPALWVGGGGGWLGAARAFAQRRWTAGMISGVSGTLCFLVSVCGWIVGGQVVHYLRQP